jgi:hypothetical protein
MTIPTTSPIICLKPNPGTPPTFNTSAKIERSKRISPAIIKITPNELLPFTFTLLCENFGFLICCVSYFSKSINTQHSLS